MLRVLTFAVLWLATPALAAQQTVRVVDEDGEPVESFEIMWHTADKGYWLWQRAENGTWREEFYEHYGDVIDIIVRADGYASKVQRFQDESLRELLNSEATITLSRGREVRIRLDLPEAVHVPDDFVMQSYFPQFQGRVWMMWQPVNIRGQKPEWNMLNVRRVGDDEFLIRLPLDGNEFLLAFQHPGWLQFCEMGPFRDEDLNVMFSESTCPSLPQSK